MIGRVWSERHAWEGRALRLELAAGLARSGAREVAAPLLSLADAGSEHDFRASLARAGIEDKGIRSAVRKVRGRVRRGLLAAVSP